MTAPKRVRRGFTLLEVIIALAISTMVVSGCHVLLTATMQSRDAARDVGAEEIRNGNINRTLRRLVRQVERLDRDSVTAGDKLNFSQWSWCDGPRGVPDRCLLTLRIRTASDSTTLELSMGETASVVVPGIAPRRLLYLEEGDNGRQWKTTWSSRSLPRAIGIVVDADTLLLPVGT